MIKIACFIKSKQYSYNKLKLSRFLTIEIFNIRGNIDDTKILGRKFSHVFIDYNLCDDFIEKFIIPYVVIKPKYIYFF